MEMLILLKEKSLLQLECLLFGLVKSLEHIVEHHVFDEIPEFAVAEYSLEDLAVLFHAVQEFGFEGFHEAVFEVVDGIAAGLEGEGGVAEEFFLDLTEEEFVGFGEFGAEALVQEVDDLR